MAMLMLEVHYKIFLLVLTDRNNHKQSLELVWDLQF